MVQRVCTMCHTRLTVPVRRSARSFTERGTLPKRKESWYVFRTCWLAAICFSWCCLSNSVKALNNASTCNRILSHHLYGGKLKRVVVPQFDDSLLSEAVADNFSIELSITLEDMAPGFMDKQPANYMISFAFALSCISRSKFFFPELRTTSALFDRQSHNNTTRRDDEGNCKSQEKMRAGRAREGRTQRERERESQTTRRLRVCNESCGSY
jgi:hypothetical protein